MNTKVSPILVLDNASAAIDFYKRAFNAVVLMRHDTPDGKKVTHASLELNGGLLMLSDDFPEMTGTSRSPKALKGSTTTIHLNVPNVDTAYNQAVQAGAKGTMPPEDMFWGDRYAKVVDPFGHDWSFSTPVHKPTQDEIRQGTEKYFGKDAKHKSM